MDRVKLHAQERLDLDDARALQTLVYDYVQEALGGLFGHIRGALSSPIITQTENNGAPYITLSPFQFVTTTAIETGVAVSSPSAGTALSQHKTIVATYDASEESAVQISIDTIRAYYQDYVGSYLWARPISIDTDQATRVRWSVSGGAEQTFSAETRESQRVAFAIQANEPAYSANEAQWAPIAKITGWTDGDNSGSLALWQVISAYNHDINRRWFGTYVSGDELTATNTDLSVPTTSMSAYPMESGRSYRGFGVADQLAMLRYKVAQMQGFGDSDPSNTPTNRAWYLPPLISLNGVDTAINTINDERTSHILCIATATIQMYYAGSEYTYLLQRSNGISAVRASPLRTNRVCVELHNDVLSVPWNVEHISCQQLYWRQLNQSQADHYDYNRVTFHPDFSYSRPSPYSFGELTNTDNYHLDDYSTTSGRGINIEILPHYADAEEAITDKPHGTDNHVDAMISEDLTDHRFLEFTVAIFARHQNQPFIFN